MDAGAEELARLRLGAVDEQMNKPDDRCTVGRTDDPGDSEHDEATADAEPVGRHVEQSRNVTVGNTQQQDHEQDRR